MTSNLSDDDDDPTDPRHRDYDLSEGSPYSPYEEAPKPWFIRRWALIIIAVLVIAGLMLPYFRVV